MTQASGGRAMQRITYDPFRWVSPGRSWRNARLISFFVVSSQLVYVDKNLEPIGEPGTFPNLKLRALPTLVDGDAVVTESSTFLSSRLPVFLFIL
jgi:hypothetical protein